MRHSVDNTSCSHDSRRPARGSSSSSSAAARRSPSALVAAFASFQHYCLADRTVCCYTRSREDPAMTEETQTPAPGEAPTLNSEPTIASGAVHDVNLQDSKRRTTHANTREPLAIKLRKAKANVTSTGRARRRRSPSGTTASAYPRGESHPARRLGPRPRTRAHRMAA
ncbi:hypothetical protein EVAR_11070_1 [Eumeta japonica]|uniref:Uncharacterized protein n=1 Tax=Eumeta variegata TaxID=151549 RepID=A0A4C1U420_EUMVA|nr:hypothetical protein EVAR_11070_1 [Eumeta japonica]